MSSNRIVAVKAAALWLCSFAFSVCWSWIPPHPDSKLQWESVQDMRRRLNLEPFNYTTSRHLNAEWCRYLTEDECEEMDISLQEHVEDHKALQKETRRNPNLGKINVLVLMIRFSDHVDRELVPKSLVDTFWETKVPQWMEANSQGRYGIKATVIDWITTDNTEEYYSFGKRGIVLESQKMAWPILDKLDNRPNWDWSQFDLDGNGRIDSLVIIHSGYGAETTTTDCFGADFNNRIWAHAFSGTSQRSWQSKDGKIKVAGYTVASAFDEDCGTVPAKIGLTVHEYMHTLGLEDLYDGVDPLAASGIGAFDIMAFPYGQDGNADYPGHLSAYSKIIAGWLSPINIGSNGIYHLKAAEISDEAYKISLADKGVASEYLLIENRQPLEFDINIWQAGLVIYHIDNAADLQRNRGYPGQEGWPWSGNHYQVALLPKDGRYDLEKGKNSGDAGDIWVPGDKLGPGMSGTVYPSTDSYQHGNVQETGVWLSVISQTGTDITFQVGGISAETVPGGLAKPLPVFAPTITPPGPGPMNPPRPTPNAAFVPAPIPYSFGNHKEILTPTQKPVFGRGYLSSFEPFVEPVGQQGGFDGQLTATPTDRQQRSPHWDDPEGRIGPDPYLSGFQSVHQGDGLPPSAFGKATDPQGEEESEVGTGSSATTNQMSMNRTNGEESAGGNPRSPSSSADSIDSAFWTWAKSHWQSPLFCLLFVTVLTIINRLFPCSLGVVCRKHPFATIQNSKGGIVEEDSYPNDQLGCNHQFA
ncbi:Pre-pro-metalloprotease PrtV [Seminavis robusta]|uniref:Pre-pro-metalloprotease PrtV n=1 Tax=Seminavis robusta TaxID=568900 RepID=A0A9N8ESK2_9STRA|nr:Pre-pro-metalloprotease PrtV [Seminavis robusta]|eukprot:Sro1835_g300590.1 Pre-pro-metalloprotease PrtV (756) ;mRNA; r:11821-14486